MDSFKEQIVRKIPSRKDKTSTLMLRIAGFALALFLVFFTLAFIPQYLMLSILLGGFAIYGGYYFSLKNDVEYEYIFTNGELDVDKIVAQRTRKRLITMRFGSATDIGIADDDYTVSDSKTLVMASANDAELKDYYVEFSHKSYGETALVFTPDEDMLEVIKPSLPRELSNKI